MRFVFSQKPRLLQTQIAFTCRLLADFEQLTAETSCMHPMCLLFGAKRTIGIRNHARLANIPAGPGIDEDPLSEARVLVVRMKTKRPSCRKRRVVIKSWQQ